MAKYENSIKNENNFYFSYSVSSSLSLSLWIRLRLCVMQIKSAHGHRTKKASQFIESRLFSALLNMF